MIEQEITSKLEEAGFEVYIVGGAVRDFILGEIPKDYDFATNAKPNEVIRIFNDKKICVVGKSFKVVLVNDVEIATYRKDLQEVMFNPKHCKPEYAKNITEDLERRDLTINAMAIQVHKTLLNERVILDLHGGINDLNNGVIRLVGDPYTRLNQDPCRILRACRFLAKIEGTFEAETFKALQDCAHYIKSYVEPERIRIEILKAMELKVPSLFFSALHLIGGLKYIFPELDKCFQHDHGKYHKENIGEHCMHAGDVVSSRFPLLRLAAFLHDVGKPKAFKKQGDGSFICHELYGEKIVIERLQNLKFSNKEVATIANLVGSHMLQCRSLKAKGIRRLHKKLADKKVDSRSFIRLKLADRSSNMAKDASRFTPIKELIVNAGIRGYKEEIPFTVKELTISGGELIDYFNLIPGPIVGNLQKYLLNYVIEMGEEFNTRDILLKEAKLILKTI